MAAALDLPPSSSSSSPSVFFFFFFFFFFFCASAEADLQSDVEALLAFKVNFTSVANLSSWNNSTTICTNITTSSPWAGITCVNVNGSSTRVAKVELPEMDLAGAIAPNTLGKLDALQILSLQNNRLNGSIPEDLSNCKSLKSINLSHNNLSGPLPSNFSVWPQLSDLDLSSNHLSGQIPPSLDNLTTLHILLLNDNDLSGSLPPLSTVAPQLSNFSVANNQLNGSVPLSLSGFSATSFEGNAGLCGEPLPRNCSSSSPPSEPSSSNSMSLGAIAGAVVGSVAGAAVLLGICVLVLVRGLRKKKGRSEEETLELSAPGKQGLLRNAPTDDVYGMNAGADEGLTLVGNSGKSNSAQAYDLAELLRASTVVLGKGKHGTTYKTTLNNGALLRVKRLKGISIEPDACKDMLLNLGRLSDLHPNLFPIRAFYVGPQETLVISDYKSDSRSLSSLLQGKNKSKKEEVMKMSKDEEEEVMTMSWETRLAAAHGAALGLLFLHSQKNKVMHGGVKSSNVLLDKKGNATWTDYGLHQLFHAKSERKAAENEKNLRQKNIEVYYCPPEVLHSSSASSTFKGDIYAFGIVLLELLTRMSPKGLSQAAAGDPLHDWAQSKSSAANEALDSLFLEQGHGRVDPVARVQMRDMLNIAQRCLSLSPDERPEMSEVAAKIENVRKIGSSAGVDDDDGLGSQQVSESQKEGLN